MITCFFENGDKTSLRHITVNAIVIKDKQILLAKRETYNGKPILESGKWGFLGGFLDRDENIRTGLKREVFEESGWEIDNLKLFRINDSPNRPKEDRQNVDIIFIARAVKQNKVISEEVRELEWFDLDKLPIDQMAFDFGENLQLFLQYQKQKFNLPIWGDSMEYLL